ncbi:hypothetical protein JMK98_07720 [Pediococcus pentosaceus]|uniref:hypothetical protein n=1 Tax=Pediococcus pentosaceus TaxID=1255 RepID=UPI00196598C1|nr:hypothetical protein [Pediococcus pentosaceus]MBM9930368.1 hypothetical protein [Pediococcus pentosaceus]
MSFIIGVILTTVVLCFNGLISWISKNAGDLSGWIGSIVTTFGILITYANGQRKDFDIGFITTIKKSNEIASSMGQKTALYYGVFNNSSEELLINEMGFMICSPIFRKKLKQYSIRYDKKHIKSYERLEEEESFLWTNIAPKYEKKLVRIRSYVVLYNSQIIESTKTFLVNRRDFNYTPKDVLKKQKN